MIQLTAKKTKWFTFPQDETGETQVEILHLKPGKIAEIDAKANRIVGRHVNDDFVTEVDINVNSRMLEIVKASIVNWKGFQDLSGRTMKCTDANKVKLLNDFDWFFAQIELFRDELAVEFEAEQEEAEKN
jgi:hypothetical protein